MLSNKIITQYLDYTQKIFEPEQLSKQINSLDRKNIKISFTNGCFDILHCGHVDYLCKARELADVLIVALNSDESIKTLNKDINRPINKLQERLIVIASLASVDYVTYFNQSTPLELIQLLSPDILVKGGDWPIEQIVGSSYVKSYGGSVHSIPFTHQQSTTKIINKITNR